MAELKYLAIGLMCLAFMGAALGVGMITKGMLDGISRNPSAEPKMSKYMFTGLAFAEMMGLFGLVIALILIFVVK